MGEFRNLWLMLASVAFFMTYTIVVMVTGPY